MIRVFTRSGLWRFKNQERREWIAWAFKTAGVPFESLDPFWQRHPEQAVMIAISRAYADSPPANEETRQLLADVMAVKEQIEESERRWKEEGAPKVQRAITTLNRLASR